MLFNSLAEWIAHKDQNEFDGCGRQISKKRLNRRRQQAIRLIDQANEYMQQVFDAGKSNGETSGLHKPLIGGSIPSPATFSIGWGEPCRGLYCGCPGCKERIKP